MIDNLNFLTSVDIFTSLDQTELQELQGRMLPRTVEVDHPVIRQGDVGNSLFILKKGRLDVFLVEDNKNVLVGTLGPGDFFGEMSLLTGHARSATVIPVETSIVLEISKQALSFFMHRHDGLAEQMGETLSNRQMSNLKAMMEFEHSIQVIANEDLAADLSHRIRRFFELPASIWGRAVDGLSDLGFLSGKQNDEEEENKQIAFTTALIVLVAKMATVANSFEGKELVRLRDIFDIPSSEMTNVRRIYDRAQGNPKGYETYVKQISDLFDDDTAVREELIGVLLKIGGGKTETATFIEDVAGLVGLDEQVLERLRAVHLDNDLASDHVDYLKILNLQPDTRFAEGKAAYHKLAREHHPDKLMAQGMPPEFIKLANDKFAIINKAYEQFKLKHQQT